MMLNAAETAVFTVGRCAYVLHVMQWSVEIPEQYLVICSILGVIYSTSALVSSCLQYSGTWQVLAGT